MLLVRFPPEKGSDGSHGPQSHRSELSVGGGDRGSRADGCGVHLTASWTERRLPAHIHTLRSRKEQREVSLTSSPCW